MSSLFQSVLSMAFVFLLIGCSPEATKVTNKEKIIGVWIVTKSMDPAVPPREMTWEFTKDGEIIVTDKTDEGPVSFKDNYTVEEDVLTLKTIAMAFIAGNPSKIQKLDDTDLVFESKMDGKSYRIELKRKK